VPYRGKINHSILMQETCAVVAQVHRIGADEMAEITYRNACQLFKIQ
jgi:Tat protein secretion system quality control protein TatD with DNase activity